MAKRYARLYPDGSFNVDSGSTDLDTAIKRLSGSTDDDETQIVEVDIKVIATHGAPKLKVVREKCITCPTCSEEIYIEEETK